MNSTYTAPVSASRGDVVANTQLNKPGGDEVGINGSPAGGSGLSFGL